MKFLRVLPETCARTWCLFSSSTRNIAFGSGSITVAITSMASSLEFPESPFFFSSRIGLAIVSRAYLTALKTGGHNSYHAGPVIPFARAHLLDSAVQRFPGHIQQLLQFRPNLPHRDSNGGIRIVPVHFHPEIDRDDISFAQLALRRGNPVDDLAVHRRAQHTGITAISLERCLARSSGDFFLGNLLEVHRRYSRLYRASQRGQDFVHEKPGAMHLFQLFRASQVNRHQSFQGPYGPNSAALTGLPSAGFIAPRHPSARFAAPRARPLPRTSPPH